MAESRSLADISTTEMSDTSTCARRQYAARRGFTLEQIPSQLEGKDFEALKAWVLEYLERKRRKGA